MLIAFFINGVGSGMCAFTKHAVEGISSITQLVGVDFSSNVYYEATDTAVWMSTYNRDIMYGTAFKCANARNLV